MQSPSGYPVKYIIANVPKKSTARCWRIRREMISEETPSRQEYCIIVGAAMQAERKFLRAVIFILKKRKEDDYVG